MVLVSITCDCSRSFGNNSRSSSMIWTNALRPLKIVVRQGMAAARFGETRTKVSIVASRKKDFTATPWLRKRLNS